MRYFKWYTLCLIFVLVATQVSCERDDLCPASTQTTARLIIDAFDVSAQDESKSIVRLRVEGVDDNGEGIGALEGFNAQTTSRLVLPLRTDSNVTTYRLHLDYSEDEEGNPNGGNQDIITVTYITEDVFISRACGFSTIYNNVQIEVNADGIDDDLWIRSIRTENDNQIVENEAEAHFTLLH